MKAGALKSRPLLAAVSAIFAIRHDESRPCPSRTKQTGKKPRDNSTRLSWYLMPGSVLLSHGETPHYHRRYGDSGAEIPPLSCNHRLPCGIWHAESLVRWCERSILDANDQIIISVLKGCSSTNLVKTSHLSVCLDTPGMAYTSMKWSHRFLQRQKPFLYRKYVCLQLHQNRQ
mgnify:CR=1 FL=1